jgi:Predicted transcriptional regulators
MEFTLDIILQIEPAFSFYNWGEQRWNTLGQVAEITGLSIDTLRYYEKEGILPTVKRGSKNRIYGDADIEGINFICCLRNTGMTVKELKQFVQLIPGGENTIGKRVEMLNKQKERIQQEIVQLIRYTSMIDHKIKLFTLKVKGCNKDG